MDVLKEQVMKELESRNAAPKPRWHFLLTRGAAWLFAALCLLVGATAYATAHFVFLDNDGMRHLRESPVRDIARSIPFVWLFVLLIFILSAYAFFRYTRRGYKYAATVVLVTAVVGSIAIGLLFETFHLGRSVHQYLLQHTLFYNALIHSREDEPDRL